MRLSAISLVAALWCAVWHPAASLAAPAPAAPHRLVVGYLPQWALYSTPPWTAQNLITSGSAALLDQVNYAQAFVTGAHCSVADPEADLHHVYAGANSIGGAADDPAAPLRGEMHQLQLLKARYPRIRAVISLEGKPADFAIAAQPANRQAFVASCVDMFVRGHLAPGVDATRLFDGFDIDWEFPKAEDAGNYVALLAEFRRQLDEEAQTLAGRGKYGEGTSAPAGARSGTFVHNMLRRRPKTPPHLLLTLAVGPGIGRYPGVDWHEVVRYTDQVGLMNYDYSGPWMQRTGMIAPLYAIDGDPLPENTVEKTVDEYEGAGVPASQLLIGVPFYGYHWEKVNDPAHHGLFAPGKPVRDDSPYHAIAGLAPQSVLYRDPRSQTPWLYDGTTFWTFDDAISAHAKAAFANARGLAGAMIWELSGDTADGQLLSAVYSGLAGRPSPVRDTAIAAGAVQAPASAGKSATGATGTTQAGDSPGTSSPIAPPPASPLKTGQTAVSSASHVAGGGAPASGTQH